jgi:threonine dehydratase
MSDLEHEPARMTGPTALSLPTLADVTKAAERLTGLAIATPLLSHPFLDDAVGGRVFLKCENLQRTGSFKFRGAYNALAALDPASRARGILAISSGNHAQGVAEAARLFGVPATIVMPADAPSSKKARTLRNRARVVEYDRASEDREEIASKIIAEEGSILIHPFDDPNVVAGQGTIGLEIVETVHMTGVAPDAILIPCGGGGLSGGIGIAFRNAYPNAALTLVEPDGFDDAGRSLEAGERRSNPKAAGSVCDGLLAPALGAIGFALNRKHGASAITVADADTLAAVAFAFNELKLVVEPSGAVAIAAMLSRAFDVRGRTVVAVVTGGNIDQAMLERALASPQSGP